MLTVEDIKKIFDNFEVEGFTADNLGLNNIHGSCFGWGLINGYGNDIEDLAKWMYIYYPLFLQRVIEGINREYFNVNTNYQPYWIELLSKQIIVDKDDSYGYVIFELRDFDNFDQAKEQAIKFILDQME